jgi:hypothetical protein
MQAESHALMKEDESLPSYFLAGSRKEPEK